MQYICRTITVLSKKLLRKEMKDMLEAGQQYFFLEDKNKDIFAIFLFPWNFQVSKNEQVLLWYTKIFNVQTAFFVYQCVFGRWTTITILPLLCQWS